MTWDQARGEPRRQIAISAGMATDGQGNYYGTTNQGGANSFGTLFQFNSTSGQLTTLFNFNRFPNGMPVQFEDLTNVLSLLVVDYQPATPRIDVIAQDRLYLLATCPCGGRPTSCRASAH